MCTYLKPDPRAPKKLGLGGARGDLVNLDSCQATARSKLPGASGIFHTQKAKGASASSAGSAPASEACVRAGARGPGRSGSRLRGAAGQARGAQAGSPAPLPVRPVGARPPGAGATRRCNTHTEWVVPVTLRGPEGRWLPRTRPGLPAPSEKPAAVCW